MTDEGAREARRHRGAPLVGRNGSRICATANSVDPITSSFGNLRTRNPRSLSQTLRNLSATICSASSWLGPSISTTRRRSKQTKSTMYARSGPPLELRAVALPIAHGAPNQRLGLNALGALFTREAPHNQSRGFRPPLRYVSRHFSRVEHTKPSCNPLPPSWGKVARGARRMRGIAHSAMAFLSATRVAVASSTLAIADRRVALGVRLERTEPPRFARPPSSVIADVMAAFPTRGEGPRPPHLPCSARQSGLTRSSRTQSAR